ncbi:MAG TPA: carbohydrate ABC transporter permease [Spirochaetales bacterium]|nr:carbohydrate ABC transporter permease [Spirochaetales bacterium]HRY53912.1 carbohydrate ABC transporter permease [Spirochaetia bacterium]HRZ65306.1 carbohydrate ABC transporter permease [Spirochaetia bacterium]
MIDQASRARRAAGAAAGYIALIFVLALTAGPFIWMLSTSLKPLADQYDGRLLPVRPTLANYARLVKAAPFLLRQVWNSFELSFLNTLGQVLTCAAAGFVFAVFRFRGRDLVFSLLLASFVIPPQVALIPNFIVFSKLGLVGTKLPLWATAFLGGAYGTFLLRQFYSSVPVELAEAARVDGVSLPLMFWRIYLPLAKPAASALAIMTFTGTWNDLLRPLIYLPSQQKLTTLTVGLSLYQYTYSGQWTFLMACAVLAVLPILAVFFLAQRQIIEGAALTGIK